MISTSLGGDRGEGMHDAHVHGSGNRGCFEPLCLYVAIRSRALMSRDEAVETDSQRPSSLRATADVSLEDLTRENPPAQRGRRGSSTESLWAVTDRPGRCSTNSEESGHTHRGSDGSLQNVGKGHSGTRMGRRSGARTPLFAVSWVCHCFACW